MKITNGKVFIDGHFRDLEVQFDNERITAIESNIEDADVIDAGGNYVFAGLVDPHCHGAFMRSFLKDEAYGDLSEYDKRISELCLLLPQSGVTAVYPTLSGDDFEAIRDSIVDIRKIKDSMEGAKILKFHLEGTYVTLDRYDYPGRPKCSLEHTDWLVSSRYDDVAIIAIAPEMPGAIEWIDQMRQRGVMPELCHSKATSVQVKEAADHGMLLSDHLFNGLPVMHHRTSGPNEGVLLDERIRTQLTCDGYHVNPDWVRLTLKIKGLKNCLGVTDLQPVAGLSEGWHDMADGSRIEIRDGFAWRPDGHIKGGSSLMNQMMRKAHEVCGLSKEEVGSLYGENPAEILNIPDRGKIEKGRVCDFVIMDDDYEVLRTVISGKTVYEKK
ncbi:MAG: amidohydrolase family protein [Erysipelotrichaceae bacterium]|nr:amidohydrolase family protein [Erysipelotrichaceae bacterium]